MSPAKGIPSKGAALLERRFEVVDLTAEIYEEMPMYPLHQRPFIMVNNTREQAVERFGLRSGFEAHNVLMSEHTGTHTDAIFEYDEDGPTLDISPLAYYYGEAVCLDVSQVRFPDRLGPDTLMRAVDTAGVEIRDGDTVLLYTAHGERTYPSMEFLGGYPGLSHDGARWLAEQGVVNIGTDAVSIDAPDDEDFSAHAVCREYQIVNTEALVNLDQLAGQRFLYFGLPLRIRRGTGSPIRAVAVRGLL